MSEKNISLNGEDFKALIAGDFVEREGLKIFLEDIGYSVMYSLLYKEMYRNKELIPEDLLVEEKEQSYVIRKCKFCSRPSLLRKNIIGPVSCFQCRVEHRKVSQIEVHKIE